MKKDSSSYKGRAAGKKEKMEKWKLCFYRIYKDGRRDESKMSAMGSTDEVKAFIISFFDEDRIADFNEDDDGNIIGVIRSQFYLEGTETADDVKAVNGGALFAYAKYTRYNEYFYAVPYEDSKGYVRCLGADNNQLSAA